MAWVEKLSMEYGPNGTGFKVFAEVEEIPLGTRTGRVRFRGGDHRIVSIPQLLSDTEVDEEDGTPIPVAWTPEQRAQIREDFVFTKRSRSNATVLTLSAAQQTAWNGELEWDATPMRLATRVDNVLVSLGDQYEAMKVAGLLPRALTDEVSRRNL